MSNIEKPFANVIWNKAMPEKGEIIDIDIYGDGTSKRFRVLKVEGMIATLLSLNDDGKFKGNVYHPGEFDNGAIAWDYAGSTLDIELNTNYYNSLAVNIKNAIIPVNKIQSLYEEDNTYGRSPSLTADFNIDNSWDSYYSTYNRISQKTIGNRYCWALDVDDVKEYFGVTTGEVISGDALMDLFLDKIDRNGYFWLCSAKPTYDYGPFAYFAFYSYLSPVAQTGTELNLKPAFKIDLTNVDYITE